MGELTHLFDYIIPICNLGGPDFYDRIDNLQLKIDMYPSNIRLIFVEQVINSGYTTYQKCLAPDFRCNFYTVSSPIFNKPWLYNIGVNNSKLDYILLGEADCTPNDPGRYFESLKTFVDKNEIDWCWCWNRLLYFAEDKITVTRDTVPLPGMAEGGIVYFNKNYYWKIGGHNEFIQELGAMDNELIRRAETNKRRVAFPWIIYHHYHHYNKLKSDDWKHATYRKKNQTIHNQVKRNPQKYISYLKGLKLGNVNHPICEEKTWRIIT